MNDLLRLFRGTFPLTLLLCLAWLNAAGVHEHTWLPSESPVSKDVTKVVYGAGAFVALAPGDFRESSTLLRSTDGSVWEETQLPDEVSLNDVIFAKGKFVAVGTNFALPQGSRKTAFVSDEGSTWTEVDEFPQPAAEQPFAVGFALGHFWVVFDENQRNHVVSEDGWTWTERETTRPGLPVEFEDSILQAFNHVLFRGMYSNVDDDDAYAQPEFFSGAIRGLVAGEDRVVAWIRDENEDKNVFAVSGDGRIWLSFDAGGEPLHSLVETGGVFWAVGDGIAVSSRDGARWADRSTGVGETRLWDVAEGGGVLVAVGENGAIFHRSASLPPAIVSQPPASVSVPEGHPALLAVEAKMPGDASVVWKKDGEPLDHANGLELRLPAVTDADAGEYSAILSNSAGTVVSESAELVVNEASAQPVAIEHLAGFDGNLSRITAGDSGVFAFGESDTSEFVHSLLQAIRGADAAWSPNGVHWRGARFGSRVALQTLGFEKGQYWAAGSIDDSGLQDTDAFFFSDDAIAWRKGLAASGTLVAEYDGDFFVLADGRVYTSPDAREWTSPDLDLPTRIRFPQADRYLVVDGRLIITNVVSIVDWDGTEGRALSIYRAAHYPRLAYDGDAFLHLPRRKGDDFVRLSHNLEEWTVVREFDGGRDLVEHEGEFFVVGTKENESGAAPFLKTSSDGVWWADRSTGLGSEALNTSVVYEDFLYAMGDGGNVYRRPAALEPAFVEQPGEKLARAGHPLRLTARAEGSGTIAYQWFHDGEPVEGATGTALEISSWNEDREGDYHVVATNSVGSVESDTVFIPTVPIEILTWEQRSDGFLESRAAVEPSAAAGNGTIAVISNRRTGIVSLSRDAGTWIDTQPPLMPDVIFFAGGRFFLFGEGRDSSGTYIGVSTDGSRWDVSEFPVRVQSISGVAYGNGIYVITGAHWVFSSGDLDKWEARQSVSSNAVVFGNGRFVFAGSKGTIQVWDNGQGGPTYELPDFQVDDRFSFPIVNLAYGNGYFLASFSSRQGDDSLIYRSANGKDWEKVGTAGRIDHLAFAGGKFWKSNLRASTDGERWVERHRNIPGEITLKSMVLKADDYEIVSHVSGDIWTRSGQLEPVFYESSMEHFAYPGDDVSLDAPAQSSQPILYFWFKDSALLGTGTPLAIHNVEAADTGSYTVMAINYLGETIGDLDLHLIENYYNWQRAFRAGDEPPGPGGDPGGYGIPNILRYALHLHPDAPERNRLPRAGVIGHEGEKHLALTFQVLDGMEDLDWTVEVSRDLNNWEELDGGVVEKDVEEGRVRHIILRDPQPAGTDGSRFMRLRVEP